MFKSRNNVALLEAQDMASRLREEANTAQNKYDLVSLHKDSTCVGKGG